MYLYTKRLRAEHRTIVSSSYVEKHPSTMSHAVLAQRSPIVSHVIPTHTDDTRFPLAARAKDSLSDASNGLGCDLVNFVAHFLNGDFTVVYEDLVMKKRYRKDTLEF
jgi:hypothetical protein